MEPRKSLASSAPTAFDSAIATVLAFAVLYPLAIRGIDPHHDGLMLKGAWDVASGQTLFRDTFTQYGPLSTWIHAGALLVFGKTLYSIRLITAIAYAVTAGLLVKLWSNYLSRGWAWLTFALWICLAPEYPKIWTFLPWSSALVLPFQVGAILAWVRSARAGRRSAPWAILAGGLCALVFWTRTPVGFMMAAAMIAGELVIAARTRAYRVSFQRGMYLLLGMGLVHLAFVGKLMMTGTLVGWFNQCLLWPSQWAQNLGMDVPNVLKILFMLKSGFFVDTVPEFPLALRVLGLVAFGGLLLLPRFARLPAFGNKAWILTALALLVIAAGCDWEPFRTSVSWGFLLPLIWLIGGGSLLASPREQVSANLAPIMTLAVTLASWGQYFPINCPRHIFWAATPGIGLAVWLLRRANQASTRTFRGVPALAVAISLLVLPLVGSRAAQLLSKVRFLESEVPAGPLRGMRLSEQEIWEFAELDSKVAQLLAKRPDVPILLEGPDALFSVWVNNTTNFRPLFVNWLSITMSPEDKAKREAFVRDRRPLILVQQPLDAQIQAQMSAQHYRSVLKLAQNWGELYADFE